MALQMTSGSLRARQRVHLTLVQVRDRLHIGRAVAVLHKEALVLVVLEAVGRADDRVVEPVGVKVFECFAHTLLEVGGGNDLQVVGQFQTHLAHHTIRVLRHKLEVVDAALEATADHNLALPPGAVFRQCASDGFVASAIAADCL